MITHVVLDMGGVLVELQWQQRMERLLQRSLPMDQLHHLWVTALSTVDFESGRTDFDQFAQAFLQEFAVDSTPDQLKAEFLEIVQGPLPNCETMLATLQSSYHLSLLSNTNVAHYEKLRRHYDFFNYFDQLFLSYELGMMKPSPAIFEHVITALGTTPEKVAFFDDGARNVAAARSLGIQAHRVDGPEQILAIATTL
ncbi:MAG: HAD family phosphatase [Cyanobacteriota bacterium]|jgi:HAD superfamily hydrolase (TIGR01509 family)|nr:HAD family phosphatase [Cyanobacteriota bacterium]